MSVTFSKAQQQNRKCPNLLDMPLDVANRIIEKLNPMNLMAARKVCRNLRSAVKESGVRSDCIQLCFWDNEIGMKLFVDMKHDQCIEYREAADLKPRRFFNLLWSTENNDAASSGTVVRCNGKDRGIKGEKFLEIALNDLKSLWKHVLSFEIKNEVAKRFDIIKHFIDFLKLEKCDHVNSLKLSLDDAHDILSLFDSQTLEHITIWRFSSLFISESDQLQRIVHLNQLKNAKIFTLYGYTFGSEVLNHLFHLERFEVEIMSDFPPQAAIQIRDDLMNRSTFQSCVIRSFCSITDLFHITKVFEPEYAGGSDFEIEIEYSNDNKTFQIKFEKDIAFYSFYFVRKCMPQ